MFYFSAPTPHGLNDLLREFRNACRQNDLDPETVIRVCQFLADNPKWADHLGLQREMAATMATEMISRYTNRLSEVGLADTRKGKADE